MHSIFKPRNKQNKSTNSSSNSFISVKSPTTITQSNSNHQHIDEFGNPILTPIPAFTLASQRHKQPHHESQKELQLLYGYTGLFTEIELDSRATNQAVLLVTKQLRSCPLDSPLIFSTHALDVSIDGTHSLIRSYVHQQPDFIRDLQISSPHNLSAFLKWILARHTNERGQRGILDWQTYLEWRSAESDTNYPPDFISSHLFPALPTTTVSLLSTLLDLFSTVSAYSHLNGMTIHKCSAIFGAYIFGLEDDLTFEQTYSHWLRYAHATEHLVLAFLRDQKCKITTKQLPSRLESSISGYPKIIPSLTATHPSAKLECVARFRRQTRFYNKNLIQNASKWKIEQSKTWSRLQPTETLTGNHKRSNSNSSNSSETLGKLKFTKSYKHLLNITNDSDLDILDDLHHLDLNDELNLETQRFKSLVEKQWSGFMNKGFEETKSDKKLEFDLEESERLKRRQRHDTMDWDSFAGNGFFGRETFTPNELEFNSNLNQTIQNWPIEQKVLNKKISKASKHLPELKSIDPLPQELKPILLDENFFEAYADALVCSGWARDELKEVSWALVHYKSRSINCDPNDERNDDMWVLFEEVVPAEYRQMLVASNSKAAKRHRRTSFLRVITRKDHKRNHVSPQSNSTGRPPQSKLPSLSAPYSPTLDGSFPPTRKLTLTRQLPSDTISIHTRPSTTTINSTNTIVNAGSGFVSTGGFMAEFRAKTKKRHQNYNLPSSSSSSSTTTTKNIIFPHQTASILEQPGSQVWLNVLPEEREEEEEEEEEEDYDDHDHYRHHQIHRPMNPTPPGSSRAVTPEDRLKRHHYPKRSIIPNRKESLSNLNHHLSSDITTLSDDKQMNGQLDHREEVNFKMVSFPTFGGTPDDRSSTPTNRLVTPPVQVSITTSISSSSDPSIDRLPTVIEPTSKNHPTQHQNKLSKSTLNTEPSELNSNQIGLESTKPVTSKSFAQVETSTSISVPQTQVPNSVPSPVLASTALLPKLTLPSPKTPSGRGSHQTSLNEQATSSTCSSPSSSVHQNLSNFQNHIDHSKLKHHPSLKNVSSGSNHSLDPSILPKSLRQTPERYHYQFEKNNSPISKKPPLVIKPFEARMAKVSNIVDMFEKPVTELDTKKVNNHNNNNNNNHHNNNQIESTNLIIRQNKLSRVGEE